jgi:hypothetical protein
VDFIHRLNYERNTTFRRPALLPSSGEMGRTSQLTGPLERTALSPPDWVFLPISPADGRRADLRNIVLS